MAAQRALALVHRQPRIAARRTPRTSRRRGRTASARSRGGSDRAAPARPRRDAAAMARSVGVAMPWVAACRRRSIRCSAGAAAPVARCGSNSATALCCVDALEAFERRRRGAQHDGQRRAVARAAARGRAPSSGIPPAACTTHRVPRRRRSDRDARAVQTPRSACRSRPVPPRSARARQACSRSRSVSAECSTASGASKRAAKRSTSCGVKAISGTSTSACCAACDDALDRAQVDLGLAAAGDAAQQELRIRARGAIDRLDGIALRSRAGWVRPTATTARVTVAGACWILAIHPRRSSSRTWSRHRLDQAASSASVTAVRAVSRSTSSRSRWARAAIGVSSPTRAGVLNA